MNPTQKSSPRRFGFVPTLFLCCFVLSPALVAQPLNAPLLPLNELKAGMKGEVWTVFKGQEPEPFGVEVSGIVRNALGPGKSMILCTLTDPRVQNMGAVAGMSGSPLYIDGKLAGVLSYQIQRFETVRYAGFTPIADMLEISALPAPGKVISNPAPIPIKGLDSERAAALSDFRPLQPVFSLGGLAPNVAALFETKFSALGLSAVALGGSTQGSTDTADQPAPHPHLRPGDVVAVALATGDISLAGTGTVSRVDGNRILAFGHPMLSLGATELPMANAEVVAILPSQFNSVKVSNAGAVIGTFSQDRLSGIYGEIGRQPQMVPVEVTFPGNPGRRPLHFAVVRHEQILPAVAATGLAQAVLGSNESGFSKGFRVTTTVDFPGVEPVELSQIYPGPQGFSQGLNDFVGNLSLWLFNPYERTFPSGIRFSVEEMPETPVGTIESLQLSRTAAAPGDTVEITVGWRGFQRDAQELLAHIPVPPEWAGKHLEIILATGPALDELSGHPAAVPAAQLRNFDAYISALRHVRRSDGLYLAVVERTRVFTDQRTMTRELPGSLERIAHGADEARFQRREALVPLWETHLLPDRLFNVQLRRPLQITD
ncbi:MAG: hypothetical protein HY302_01325 [Opitutae bacterium]|nr:hypothetical protein [Opitutae bacterium]